MTLSAAETNVDAEKPREMIRTYSESQSGRAALRECLVPGAFSTFLPIVDIMPRGIWTARLHVLPRPFIVMFT